MVSIQKLKAFRLALVQVQCVLHSVKYTRYRALHAVSLSGTWKSVGGKAQASLKSIGFKISEAIIAGDFEIFCHEHLQNPLIIRDTLNVLPLKETWNSQDPKENFQCNNESYFIA